MGFITKSFSHLGGSFLGRLWETAAGGPVVPTSLPVDIWGTGMDFSKLPQIAGQYRDMQLASGAPNPIAPGEDGPIQTDKYLTMRVSFAQGGREAPYYALRETTGSEVYSNTSSPVVVSVGASIDGLARRPIAARATTAVTQNNTLPAAAGVFSIFVAAGLIRLEKIDFDHLGAVPCYVRIYDVATAVSESALPPPKYMFKVRPDRPVDKSFGNLILRNGLHIRITTGVTQADIGGLAKDAIEAFNLLYAV